MERNFFGRMWAVGISRSNNFEKMVCSILVLRSPSCCVFALLRPRSAPATIVPPGVISIPNEGEFSCRHCDRLNTLKGGAYEVELAKLVRG